MRVQYDLDVQQANGVFLDLNEEDGGGAIQIRANRERKHPILASSLGTGKQEQRPDLNLQRMGGQVPVIGAAVPDTDAEQGEPGKGKGDPRQTGNGQGCCEIEGEAGVGV